jgi:DNA-binding MarR family transcriptional regulator
MSLQHELGFRNPFQNRAHEALLNVVLTGTLLAKEGDRVLRSFGLTDAQFNVLMLLKYQSNGGEINQTILGNMLLVNRSNVTGLIDRLEQAGWVKRTADSSDRRVNQVKLTSDGEHVLERAEKAYSVRVNEIMASLSSEEDIHLCSMLERVRKRLRDTQGS